MAPDPIQPAPGSMTVPPLFGWGEIVVVLLVVIVVAVAFFVVTAAGAASSRRSEWQEWLDARSDRRSETAAPGAAVSRGRGGSPSA